jgi:hypothetical protein
MALGELLSPPAVPGGIAIGRQAPGHRLGSLVIMAVVLACAGMLAA